LRAFQIQIVSLATNVQGTASLFGLLLTASPVAGHCYRFNQTVCLPRREDYSRYNSASLVQVPGCFKWEFYSRSSLRWMSIRVISCGDRRRIKI